MGSGKSGNGEREGGEWGGGRGGMGGGKGEREREEWEWGAGRVGMGRGSERGHPCGVVCLARHRLGNVVHAGQAIECTGALGIVVHDGLRRVGGASGGTGRRHASGGAVVVERGCAIVVERSRRAGEHERGAIGGGLRTNRQRIGSRSRGSKARRW